MDPGKVHTASSTGRDRIGALPDAILHRILSFLPAQQGTRTCVLARRWLHLWKSATGLRIVGADGEAPVRLHEVQEFVDHLLLLRGTSPLQECEFHIAGLPEDDVPRMNLWIRHAVMCKVRVLQLYFFGNPAVLQPEGTSLVSWHLTKLMLRGLVFNNEFLNFSRCPSLQDVQIVGCSFMHVSKISSQSLKRLVIIAGLFSPSFRTHIHAPNLIWLQLHVSDGRVPVLETMPPLLTADIIIDSCADCCICGYCGDYCVESCQGFLQNDGSCVLLQGLLQAGTLALVSGAETFIFRRDLKWCPTFRQLKHLVLDEHWFVPDVHALACILEHSPALEELGLISFSEVYNFLMDMSGVELGRELEEGIWRRLYSDAVAGRGPGPRRRGGAMMLDGAKRRQGTRGSRLQSKT